MNNIPSKLFVDICKAHKCDIATVKDELKKKGYDRPANSIRAKISKFRKRGLLPLDHGMQVPVGEILKGTSVYYDLEEGKPKRGWVKTNVEMESQLKAMREAIEDMCISLPQRAIGETPQVALGDMTTMYISNDIHYGALMWSKETGDRDWNLEIAQEEHLSAVDYLVEHSPASETAIVVDLGDLTEIDDFKNATPKSGHNLSVDSRFPKILRTAYEGLIYTIEKALTKHKLVYFYNIAGNHDVSNGHAVREIVRAYFKDEDRVIVDESPSLIKYHAFGANLFQFAHGDGMKMKDAGEVMALDMSRQFSNSVHRYSHFGHNHVDKVIDTRLCKVESHRNLAPNNDWAAASGYRRGLGSMKSITYHIDKGEITRNTYTV